MVGRLIGGAFRVREISPNGGRMLSPEGSRIGCQDLRMFDRKRLRSCSLRCYSCCDNLCYMNSARFGPVKAVQTRYLGMQFAKRRKKLHRFPEDVRRSQRDRSLMMSREERSNKEIVILSPESGKVLPRW